MANRWREREIRLLRSLGFMPTPGSGNTWVKPEDGESDELVAQVKATDSGSIPVTRITLNDLRKHARTAHKLPVLILDYGGSEIWAAIPLERLLDVSVSLINQMETVQSHAETNHPQSYLTVLPTEDDGTAGGSGQDASDESTGGMADDPEQGT